MPRLYDCFRNEKTDCHDCEYYNDFDCNLFTNATDKKTIQVVCQVNDCSMCGWYNESTDQCNAVNPIPSRKPSETLKLVKKAISEKYQTDQPIAFVESVLKKEMQPLPKKKTTSLLDWCKK